MEYEDIERIVIIYGKRKYMDKFITHFWEFWERDGENLKFREIPNTPHSWFKDLRHFIWKGD